MVDGDPGQSQLSARTAPRSHGLTKRFFSGGRSKLCPDACREPLRLARLASRPSRPSSASAARDPLAVGPSCSTVLSPMVRFSATVDRETDVETASSEEPAESGGGARSRSGDADSGAASAMSCDGSWLGEVGMLESGQG